MPRPLCLLCALILCTAASDGVRAQFVVEQSSPAHGSVNVPLVDTVAFAFSEAVSVETDWNASFVYEPSDSVHVTRVALCINFEGVCAGGEDVPRFVRYTVEHRPDTDYTWFVQGVHASDGQTVAAPYALRYSTASTIGPHTVSGRLTVASTAPASHSPAHRTVLRRLSDYLERHDQGRPVFSRSDPETDSEGPIASLQSSPSSTFLSKSADLVGQADPQIRVLLLANFTVVEPRWQVQAGTVVSGDTDEYRIDFVRSGTYWPLAVRYTDAASEEIDAIGYFDPDGDGAPDSVTVSEADRIAVDLTLFAFSLSTARTNLQAAQASAGQYAADQELVTIRAQDGARPSGFAYAWTYAFYSRERDLLTTVRVDPLAVMADTMTTPSYVESMTPIDPESFVDSETALRVVAEDGGEEFWGDYPLRNLITVIEGGHFYWRDLPDPERGVWYVRVTVVTSSQTRVLEKFVDLRTGAILNTSAEDAGLPRSAGVLLHPAYPNPFAYEAYVPFTVSRTASVTLSVYDLLGRRVAALIENQRMPPGTHRIRWTSPGAASGTYVYRLVVDGYTAAGKLVRLSP